MQGSSIILSCIIDGVPTFTHIPMGDLLGVVCRHHDQSQTNKGSLKMIVEVIQLENGPCGVSLQRGIWSSLSVTFAMLSKVKSNYLKLIFAGFRQEIDPIWSWLSTVPLNTFVGRTCRSVIDVSGSVLLAQCSSCCRSCCIAVDNFLFCQEIGFLAGVYSLVALVIRLG